MQAISGYFTYGRAEDDESREMGTKMMTNSFEKFEKFMKNQRDANFIGGDRPRFNDFVFWPILERIAVRHRNLVEGNETVGEYYRLMLADESVKACHLPDEVENVFIEAYFNKDSTKYDVR